MDDAYLRKQSETKLEHETSVNTMSEDDRSSHAETSKTNRDLLSPPHYDPTKNEENIENLDMESQIEIKNEYHSQITHKNLHSIDATRDKLLQDMNNIVQDAQQSFETKLLAIDELENKMMNIVNDACESSRNNLMMAREKFFEQLTSTIEQFERDNSSCSQLLQRLNIIQSELKIAIPRIGLPL